MTFFKIRQLFFAPAASAADLDDASARPTDVLESEQYLGVLYGLSGPTQAVTVTTVTTLSDPDGAGGLPTTTQGHVPSPVTAAG